MVVYDIYPNSALERVSSIKERCGDALCHLQMEKLYSVVMPSYLAGGGSRLHNFPDLIEDHQVGGVVDFVGFSSFVKQNSPLNPTLEGRIIKNFHLKNPNHI